MAITVAARFTIKAGHEQEKVDLLRRYATEGVTNEPGTPVWDIYQCQVANDYFCLSEFVDEAAIADHGKNSAPYFVEDEASNDTGALMERGGNRGSLLISLPGVNPTVEALRAADAITVLSRFTINEGFEKPQLAFLEDFAKWIAANEPNTLRWDVYHDANKGEYFCIETFTDEASMNLHGENGNARFANAPSEALQTEMLGQDFSHFLLGKAR